MQASRPFGSDALAGICVLKLLMIEISILMDGHQKTTKTGEDYKALHTELSAFDTGQMLL